MPIHSVKVDTELIEDKGSQCGSCHKPIRKKGGVVFGRSSLHFPAIYICHNCLYLALALIDPLDLGPFLYQMKTYNSLVSRSLRKRRRRS